MNTYFTLQCFFLHWAHLSRKASSPALPEAGHTQPDPREP